MAPRFLRLAAALAALGADWPPRTQTVSCEPPAFVNADAVAGELRVEVLDGQGRAVPPFTRAACLPIRTDTTLQLVTWRGARDLSALAGQPVRFRFHLRHAKL